MGKVGVQDVEANSQSDSRTTSAGGVEGVRIYLEDGAFSVTDADGLFHFEGIEPGVHVVQLDVDSLPQNYQLVNRENNRFSGRAYSQFVDLQPGAMWRTDFIVRGETTTRRLCQPAIE